MIPDLVVFDIAGTLLDEGSKAPILAFQDAFLEIGINLSAESVRQSGLGQGKREHLDTLCDIYDIDRAQRRLLWASLLEHLDRHVRARARWIDGAKETVEVLRQQSKIGVSTGYIRPQLEILIPTLGDLFTICRSDVARGRPAPDMILAIMEHFGVKDASRVAKVGDTPDDMQAAINAGAVPIGVGSERDSLVRAGALAITTIAELPYVMAAL